MFATAAKWTRRSSAPSPSFPSPAPISPCCRSWRAAQAGDGAEVYGQLMAAIGVGSIVATLALGWLKTRLGANGQAALGALGTVVSLFLLAAAREPVLAFVASFISGACVDRRADDLFCLGAGGFAGMGARSGPGDFPHRLLRRADARQRRLGRSRDGSRACPSRSSRAGVGALIGLALTWAWKLQTSEAQDLSPSMRWRAPIFPQSGRRR